MASSGPNKKVANSLVAVSCAAILGVYTAGYARTRAAANQFDQRVERRAVAPVPSEAASVVTAPESPNQELPRHEIAPPSAGPRPRAVPQATNVAAPEEPTAVVANGTATLVETVAAVVPPPAPPVPTAVAPPPPVAVTPIAPTPTPPPATKWKDGTFTGWGTSRHGDIQAAVLIEDGRIISATITQCLTRYSCDVIDMLPPQVPKRQSAEVDFVSRATESADAFYYAVSEALSKAK